MKIITDAGLAIASPLIVHFEGTVLHPYQDIRGIWTIGNGNTTLLDGTPVDADTAPITAAQAAELLDQTLRLKVAPRLDASLTHTLTEHQQGALLSLVWNIGNGAFSTSTIHRLINLGSMTSVGRHFVDWCHCAGAFCRPLYNRRLAEEHVWQTGDVAPATTPATRAIMQPKTPAARVTADTLNSAELARIGA